MPKRDMYVDKEVLWQAGCDIQRTVRVLQELADGLHRNVTWASKEFTSVNFFNAADYVAATMRVLNEAYNRVEDLKRYLGRLENCVENYLRCGYDD